MDVLENDTDLDALLGLSLKKLVEAVPGHAGPAQTELCYTSAQPRKQSDLACQDLPGDSHQSWI